MRDGVAHLMAALGGIALSLVLPGAAPVKAGLVQAAVGGQSVSLPVRSMREALFRATVRQRYDFSCGSAALATLLTHHYEHPVAEEAAFQAMFEAGDREKIRREGFSLLDMKRYLASLGYRSDGFRVPLGALAEAGVPAITLVNDRGYKHFVVIKGLDERRVLYGDPAQGLTAVPRPAFERMWNGVLFLIRDRTDLGSRHFNDREEWRTKPRAPLRAAVDQGTLGSFHLLLPPASDL